MADYVTAVRRRWVTALIVMLAVVAVAAAYSTARPVDDQATALIGIGAPAEAGAEAGPVPWLDALDPAEEVSILAGAVVKQSVREILGRLPDATAQQLGDAAVLSVTVTDEDAEAAADAANAYAAAYIEVRNGMRRARLEVIHSSLETTAAAIDRPTTAGGAGSVDPETVAELRLAADLLEAAATSGRLAEIEVAARQLQQAATAGGAGDALTAVRRAQIEQLADLASVGLEAIEAFGPRLLDPAVGDDGSSSPGFDRVLVAAAVAGLLLGLLAAVARDATDPKVRDAGDVEVDDATPVIDLRRDTFHGMGRFRSAVLLALPDGGAVQVLSASTADASAVARELAASLEGAGLAAEVRETARSIQEQKTTPLTPSRLADLRNDVAPGTLMLVPCASLAADPDGYLVASAVDATILVVASHRDRRDVVRRSAQEITSAGGAPMLGVALTDGQLA